MCHVKAALGGVRKRIAGSFISCRLSLLGQRGERAFQAADHDANCSAVSMCYFLNCIILNAAVEPALSFQQTACAGMLLHYCQWSLILNNQRFQEREAHSGVCSSGNQ